MKATYHLLARKHMHGNVCVCVCVCVCLSVCLSVCLVSECPWKSEKGVRLSGLRCKLPTVSLATKLDTLSSNPETS